MSLNIQHLENEIIDQYLYDENPNRPWIIGFSGGKDSTMLLQVVWNALRKVEPILLTRQIFVVCNDTLVENPRIVRFINETLKKIQEAANDQQIPLIVAQTVPKLEDTFWVKLIGLGYPAPNKVHRWCTDRLKIDPTTRFILEKVDENGEAIILLGTRSAESTNRAAQIKRNEVKNQRLRKHLLRNAYVFAPIKDVTTKEVWQYLNQVAPPWGGTHKELVTLYRNANAGDCPLVIDDTTPSCGNSRFGCWVCTVVNKDKSMEGLIENGEEWMEPLSEIRNFLVEAREKPERYREKRRRNGSISDDKWGPYSYETRIEILARILEAQKEIQATENIELITHQEMVLIQYYWYRDNLFHTKVSDIYNNVYKRNLNMSRHHKNTKKETDLLYSSCKEEPKDVSLIQDLLALQKTKTLMIKKRGLQADIESRIDLFVEENQQKGEIYK
ncbi:DNA phosphorothioation system sulfurtransferase DndC [Mucilaginibacter sp. RS28]|uniref:DNA phosphorothioation system sulfurtransferase DndC n=1 Tax=Mucilaginibacter straminoryzae TaxID=2932774 RepID=A0A9X1X5I1_9SPHI|nr:DNA phosphorothioation system sulfurtransferase DndC [Mucilaginibacter straminoryzae]MCJ8210815.1 DNA phosphorothioation system sulfurtransferase DndC [Mucilaginibacter straminoryzae]